MTRYFQSFETNYRSCVKAADVRETVTSGGVTHGSDAAMMEVKRSYRLENTRDSHRYLPGSQGTGLAMLTVSVLGGVKS